jgi:hypothetical protein
MAIDRTHRRLFIGCNNEHVGRPMMAVADPDSGKILTTVPIGPHVDATAYEPSTGLIFDANNGSVTVIHQDSPDKYSVVETVETQFKANTLALDPRTITFLRPTLVHAPEPVTRSGQYVLWSPDLQSFSVRQLRLQMKVPGA